MKKEINVKRYAWVVLMLMCLGITMPNYAQYQVPAFGPTIQESMKLVPSQFSTIATAPLLPGIFLSLIAGLLVDKFGTRRILVTAMAISAVAIVLRVFTKEFWGMYLTMIFTGVAATFLNSNAGKILGQWFSPEKMAVGMGIFLAAANASMSLGTGTASLYSGIHGAFIGSAVLAVIVLAAWLLLMRDRPREQSAEGTAPERISILDGLKIAATSRTVWMAAVCMFLAAGGITSMANFMPSALNERGFAESACNVVSMAITLGGLVGCLISPSTVKFFRNKRAYFICHAAVAVIGMLFAWRISESPVVTFILLFITGYCANGFSPLIMSMPVQDKKIGTRYGGTAGGFVATVQLGGSVVIPSYIIAPIATRADGSCNYAVYFTLIAVMMAIFIGVCNLLPGVAGKKEA